MALQPPSPLETVLFHWLSVLQPTQIGVRIQGRTLLVKNSSYEYRSTYLVACTSAISIAKMT
jgi:hypothetical protein